MLLCVVICASTLPYLSCYCPTVPSSGGGGQQHSPLKRSVSLTPPMSGPSSQTLSHVWLSQEDLRTTRGPAPDHAPLSPQSSIASSGSGGSEHLEEAGLGGGSSLHRSSFHEEGSGMRGKMQSSSYYCFLSIIGVLSINSQKLEKSIL